MVEVATSAVQLELQALGGRAWLRGEDGGFQRRWREAAFLPVVTPTLAQLKTESARFTGGS
jgi:alkylation response protein AidB-like acyl-CoA dehydrogenase